DNAGAAADAEQESALRNDAEGEVAGLRGDEGRCQSGVEGVEGSGSGLLPVAVSRFNTVAVAGLIGGEVGEGPGRGVHDRQTREAVGDRPRGRVEVDCGEALRSEERRV